MAEITADASLLTKLVDKVNEAVIAPAGMTIDVGTMALKLDDANETVVPPDGAGPDIEIVPVVDVPPLTGFTDQTKDDGIGARTLTKTLWLVS